MSDTIQPETPSAQLMCRKAGAAIQPVAEKLSDSARKEIEKY